MSMKNILNNIITKFERIYNKIYKIVFKKSMRIKEKSDNINNNNVNTFKIDTQEILTEYQEISKSGILNIEPKQENMKILSNDKITGVFKAIDKKSYMYIFGVAIISILMLLIAVITQTFYPKTIKEGIIPVIKYKNMTIKIVAKSNNNIENVFKVVNPINEEDQNNPYRIPVESKYKEAIQTKIKYEDFKGNNSTVNGQMPDFNLEKNAETQKVINYLEELEKKIRDEIGSSSTQNNIINLNYQGYNYKNFVSLVTKYRDNNKEEIKTFNYDFFDKKIITIEEYFKKRGIIFKKIKNEIRKEAKNRKQAEPNFNNFLIDEIGNVYIYTSPDKYLYIEIHN